MNAKKGFSINPWPVAIIGWFVIFTTFTVVIVTYLSRQKTELVQTDYYDDEIRYQEQLDRLNRTQKLKEPVSVIYDAGKSTIAVTLPVARQNPGAPNNITGRIRLYRPANESLDKEIQLAPDSAGSQIIDTRNLAAGLWKVRVYWTMNGEDYYFNQPIQVLSSRS